MNKPWRHTPDRFYRDVWLFVVSVIVLWAVIAAHTASERALHAVQAVQANRLETIGRDCRQQNARNLATIARLNAQINALPPNTRIHARAKRSRKFTIGLINALDPVQDCTVIVARSRVPH